MTQIPHNKARNRNTFYFSLEFHKSTSQATKQAFLFQAILGK